MSEAGQDVRLKEGETYFGFEVLSIRDIPEYRSKAVRCIHRATGCELLHLVNDEPENLFGFIFRTPPQDDTGVAHILEHSVLCGSRRFPVKDPFVVLLKSSLHTFLNAMTFPDKTAYPASSMLEKDFYNLMLVYGDAVFFPLLSKEVFMQEGHHLEFEDPDDLESDLKRIGVVFNEMKGVFSSPESIIASRSVRSLFPDTPYGFESGGDPKRIPDLTFEQFVRFHKNTHHPSNCRIFLYGNIPTLKHLRFLEESFLKSFSRAKTGSAVPFQRRWRKPRYLEKTFPARESGPGKGPGSTVTMNWLTVPVADPLRLLSFEVLTEVLVGHAGSPLNKALLESGLGEDISPSTGLDRDLKEAVFSMGLRGTERAKCKEIEELILSTLKRLRDEGVDDETFQAAVRRVEFRHREIRRGGRPYSLKLMRRALRGWLHGAGPETTLEFSPWMKLFKEKAGPGKRYLEELIDECLLENPHRSTLLVEPDPSQAESEDVEARRALASFKKKLSGQKLREIRADVERLKHFQEEPDYPEALRKIPSIRLQDLPGEVEKIPTEIINDSGVPVYFHDLFTNGVIYLDIILDTSGLEERLSGLLPLFGRAVCGSGLPDLSYSEVARRLALLTGGFYAGLSAGRPVGSKTGVREQILFRVKMLADRPAESLSLVWNLLEQADFDDLNRLEKIILELRNDLKASLVPAGHHYASLRAGSRLSAALNIEERWMGISQAFSLASLSSGLEKKLPGIARSLKSLREIIISRNRLTINLTAEREALKPIMEELKPLVSSLSPGSHLPGTGRKSRSFVRKPPVEAFAASAGVGYVARVVKGADYGSKEDAWLTVLSNFLSTGFLWERIRMRGGAYGAFAVPNGLEGVFTFSSYRDPNILETFRAYREALAFVKEARIDDDQLEKAVIGTVSREVRPFDPAEKGLVALKRLLFGITDDLRQERRNNILSITGPDLKRSAEILLAAFDGGCSVVLSNRRALELAGEKMKELKENIREIPE